MRLFPDDDELIDALFDLLRLPPELAALVSDSPEVPRRIGRYPVVKFLGQGGFGVVYLGYDDRLERPVAIKVAKGTYSSLLADARKAATLRHEGIVTIHAIEEASNGAFFLVMEFLEGGALSEQIERGSRLSVANTVRLMAQMADAVQHAHTHGIVHRDLKPDNILLDREDKPHITDFGLAFYHTQAGERTGEGRGTVRYMSPEQIRKGENSLDARTDVWSLGVILYELLTGELPFDGDSRESLCEAILNDCPTPPRQLNPDTNRKLENVVFRCLAKDPAHRYSSAGEFASSLRETLHPTRTRSSATVLAASVLLMLGVCSIYGLVNLSNPLEKRDQLWDDRWTDSRVPGSAIPSGAVPRIQDPSAKHREVPTIGWLVASPSPVMEEGLLTLTARKVQSPDGDRHVARVAFYRDGNGDGIPQQTELLGTDERAKDGWSISIPANFGVGQHSYIAQAQDTDGRDSQVALTRGCLIDRHWREFLLVSSQQTHSVIRFDAATGQVVDVVAEGGLLKCPRGLAVGPDQLLYVASTKSNCILRYRVNPPCFVDVFVGDDPRTTADENNGLVAPFDVAFDRAGNLLVSTGDNRKVLRYDRRGNPFCGQFGTPGTAEFIRPGRGKLDDERIHHANGLAFGPDGLLYVSNYFSDDDRSSVLRFCPSTGSFVDEFVAASQKLVEAWGLTFGPRGDIIVASFEGNLCERFDGQTGEAIRRLPGETIFSISDVAYGCRGDLYVSSFTHDLVAVIDVATGSIKRRLIAEGLKAPAALCLYTEIPVSQTFPIKQRSFSTFPAREMATARKFAASVDFSDLTTGDCLVSHYCWHKGSGPQNNVLRLPVSLEQH